MPVGQSFPTDPPTKWRKLMKKILAIAAVVAGLGTASSIAHAQGYVVNGHTASPAEVQLLASYGFSSGHWVVDGWGISPAHSEALAAGMSSRRSSANDRQ
jgi:hypothetical protein